MHLLQAAYAKDRYVLDRNLFVDKFFVLLLRITLPAQVSMVIRNGLSAVLRQ